MELIDKAIEYVNELFSGNSDGHDVQHTIRVYKNVQLISESYPEVDLFISSLSALLHDVDDHKLFKTENNANARAFLNENGVSEENIEKICEVINGVSFSKNRGKTPGTLEGKIVQDADRLDAIGAVGIARTFAYGGKVGRPLDDSVQHFYDKLLRLKDEMNTEAAKEIAMKRHEYMEGFLKEYFEELGE
ncbi:HD domain-containing protein [Butyrivibrio sp. INlla16]|uniref:HD domain-containing protein n=1 Tax=Butyrivibrio sp. INlla16 TaxID=1520807 RepID=UPI0008918282|nr:HD domain-containing protein [Butyrivibrio sp. INlla16]SDB64212.1 uncharacterized protein SAMN02910263_03563 [Butyrivibrio sp. INlla16]